MFGKLFFTIFTEAIIMYYTILLHTLFTFLTTTFDLSLLCSAVHEHKLKDCVFFLKKLKACYIEFFEPNSNKFNWLMMSIKSEHKSLNIFLLHPHS